MELCKWCGHKGDCGGSIDECANCWIVRRRLAEFLQSTVNADFVVQELAKVMNLHVVMEAWPDDRY